MLLNIQVFPLLVSMTETPTRRLRQVEFDEVASVPGPNPSGDALRFL